MTVRRQQTSTEVLENVMEESEGATTTNNSSFLDMLRNIVKNPQFDVVAGILILCNAFIMILEIEYLGQLASRKVGKGGAGEDDWPPAEAVFTVCEHIFCIVFAVELILRLSVYGTTFFRSMTNWL